MFPNLRAVPLLTFWLSRLHVLGNTLTNNRSRTCKNIPTDAGWPSAAEWRTFNASIDGRLIRTIPIGTPCHFPTYDESRCRASWHLSAFHAESSFSMMTPFFANLSCDPFTSPGDQCILGTYVQYAVNVSLPIHIYKTLDFVKKHNIRFVVQNTGHDYMGKSTGANALSIWTHFIWETLWIEDFESSSYRGVEVTAQAGVTAHILYEQADSRGLAIVGGECPRRNSRSLYPGRGHSMLSSVYGLAADQILEFEVITTEGEFLALSGGGGGTYGIVWSMTIKAHKDAPLAFATIEFTSEGISADTFWAGINTYHASTPSYTAAGGFAIATYTTEILPNLSSADAALLIQPFLTTLDALKIKYTHSLVTHPGFLSASQSLPNVAVGTGQFGGCLFPGSLWKDPQSFGRMTRIIRDIIEDGGSCFDVALHPSLEVAGNPDNSVLPAWRDTERLFITVLPWDDFASWDQILQERAKITWKFDEPLRRLAPDSGAYLNEADSSEPDWKMAFYGKNYPHLLAIKDRYDPSQLLFGSTAVGGDRWVEREGGRLCPV
ncbi:hypothetical protein C8J57DRAFT_1451069 [Mycena rebaudengoi]|nr:hypothetical protein C8J57DRAFT_1451069 [Mycena rebaudengoi]